MTIRFTTCLLICGLLSCNTVRSESDGEALFVVCSACHTIGEGKRVGPDLQGISERRSEEWIIKFVQNSTDLIASGDPDAIAVFEEYNNMPMPPNDLSDDEVRSLIAFIDSHGADAEEGEDEEEIEEVVYTQEQIDAGARLFSGEDRLEGGGASCISCHNIKYDAFTSGGGLALDLTESYSRISGPGIAAMIENPQYPAMKQAYLGRDISDDEVAKLTAFLVHVDTEKDKHEGGNASATLLTWGVAGFITVMLVLGIFSRKVKAKSVNQAIYDRQITST